MKVPTVEELAKLKTSVQTDWSPVYRMLAEHGRILFEKEPINLRAAISNRYRNNRSTKARVMKLPDGRVLVYTEPRP